MEARKHDSSSLFNKAPLGAKVTCQQRNSLGEGDQSDTSAAGEASFTHNKEMHPVRGLTHLSGREAKKTKRPASRDPHKRKNAGSPHHGLGLAMRVTTQKQDRADPVSGKW